MAFLKFGLVKCFSLLFKAKLPTLRCELWHTTQASTVLQSKLEITRMFIHRVQTI